MVTDWGDETEVQKGVPAWDDDLPSRDDRHHLGAVRERHLGEIIEEFEALRDEKYGIVNVDVTSAIEFTPSQRKDLADELERYTRKKVRVRIAVDKAIKGGLVVRIGDTVLDASVRRQLEILRERFLSGGPLTN